MMVGREQLLAALWRQTDDLLTRTRRQIDALSARQPNETDAPRDLRDANDGDRDCGAEPAPRPRF
jgi:hypothetical protein